MRVRQIGIAAGGEGAQQIERRRRLPIGLQLPARIRRARLGREIGAVDDVAAIDRQLDAVALFRRRGARLGELAGDAADLHHGLGRRVGQHHRHLQEQPEEVADIVGAVLGKALRAIAALQQEHVAGRDLRQRLFQIARLAGKNQRREGRKLRLDVGQRLWVRIIRHLQSRLGAPGVPGSTSPRSNASTSHVSMYRHPDGQQRRSQHAAACPESISHYPVRPHGSSGGIGRRCIHPDRLRPKNQPIPRLPGRSSRFLSAS